MPTATVKAENRVNILQFLAQIGIASSKSEARRLIEQGGIAIDDQKVGMIDAQIDLVLGNTLVVKKGKKTFLKVIVE